MEQATSKHGALIDVDLADGARRVDGRSARRGGRAAAAGGGGGGGVLVPDGSTRETLLLLALELLLAKALTTLLLATELALVALATLILLELESRLTLQLGLELFLREMLLALALHGSDALPLTSVGFGLLLLLGTPTRLDLGLALQNARSLVGAHAIDTSTANELALDLGDLVISTLSRRRERLAARRARGTRSVKVAAAQYERVGSIADEAVVTTRAHDRARHAHVATELAAQQRERVGDDLLAAELAATTNIVEDQPAQPSAVDDIDGTHGALALYANDATSDRKDRAVGAFLRATATRKETHRGARVDPQAPSTTLLEGEVRGGHQTTPPRRREANGARQQEGRRGSETRSSSLLFYRAPENLCLSARLALSSPLFSLALLLLVWWLARRKRSGLRLRKQASGSILSSILCGERTSTTPEIGWWPFGGLRRQAENGCRRRRHERGRAAGSGTRLVGYAAATRSH